MSRIPSSGSEPSRITVFQWRLLRWYPGITAACAPRSPSASQGSHLRLTRSESALADGSELPLETAVERALAVG